MKVIRISFNIAVERAQFLQLLFKTGECLKRSHWASQYGDAEQINDVFDSNRLPAVKLKLTSDANIPPSEFKIYHDLFVSELNRITIATLSGETMTLAQYLREAMTLICYSEVINQLQSPNAAKVMAAFEGYQRRTFTQPILELMQLLYRFSALMSDLSVSVLEYDLNPVSAFGGNSETNHITIRLIKSQAI